MSPTKNAAELAGRMAEHEFTDDEKAECLRLIEDDDATEDDAIAAVLAARDPAPEASGLTAEEEETGEPSGDRIAQLQEALDAHHRDVAAIMGPFVEGWQTCPHCDGIGLGEPEPEVKENENFRECPVCNGYAKVKTGSRDPQFALAPCPGCGGRGFQQRTDRQDPNVAQPVVPPPVSPLPAPAAVDGAVNGNGDQGADEAWGTPAWMGDPTIGS